MHAGSLGKVLKKSIFCFADKLKMADLLAISRPFLIFRQNKKYSFLIPRLSYLYGKFQLNPTISGQKSNILYWPLDPLFSFIHLCLCRQTEWTNYSILYTCPTMGVDRVRPKRRANLHYGPKFGLSPNRCSLNISSYKGSRQSGPTIQFYTPVLQWE